MCTGDWFPDWHYLILYRESGGSTSHSLLLRLEAGPGGPSRCPYTDALQ